MGSIIGVDEAGRGPVLGPLVVAGFKLASEESVRHLNEIKVADSKKCTPARRNRLAIELKNMGEYSIEILSASDIDEYRKIKTLNVIESELFGKVINKLNPDHESTIIVDSADANETTFKKNVEAQLEIHGAQIISEHKADDNYKIVAAASILAKTERDAQVEKIAKKLNKELSLELGSGYPSDPFTVKFLENWIKEKGDLPPHTRRSWNTAKKLMQRIKNPNKTLDQFDD